MEFEALDFWKEIGDAAMPLAVFLGNHGIIWIPLCCVLTVIPKTRKTGIIMAAGLCWAVILGDGIINHLIIWGRSCDANTDIWMMMNNIVRFPSGSAAAFFAVLTGLCFSKKTYFWEAAPAAACVIVLSRSGNLNPTDVKAGMAIGAISGYAGCKTVEALQRRRKKKTGKE